MLDEIFKVNTTEVLKMIYVLDTTEVLDEIKVLDTAEVPDELMQKSTAEVHSGSNARPRKRPMGWTPPRCWTRSTR